MKRAQVSVAGVVLIVILLIIVLMTIVVIAIWPYISFKTPNAAATNVPVASPTPEKNELTCNSPYIQVGNTCCLDKNMNRVCDSDENIPEQQTTRTCYPPYIRYSSGCCLDQDEDKICDFLEQDRLRDVARITSRNMDSPFRLSSIDIERDELSFDLENREDTDYIITNIDLDDCDSESPNKLIPGDSEKSFSLDCDFNGDTFSLDIEIEYKDPATNLTDTAEGKIRGEFVNNEDFILD